MQTGIRLAGEDDLPTLLSMMQEYYAHDRLGFDESAAFAALRGLLDDEALGCIWLVCADDVVVGYIVLTFGYSLEFGGRDAFIDEFYIREAYRGCGIGTQTLARVESAARFTGIAALHLEVERKNQGARRFYRARGFCDRRRFHLMSKSL